VEKSGWHARRSPAGCQKGGEGERDGDFSRAVLGWTSGWLAHSIETPYGSPVRAPPRAKCRVCPPCAAGRMADLTGTGARSGGQVRERRSK